MRDKGPGQDESHIADVILAYLKSHPDAEDSLEGVVEWWLREQTIRHRTEMVKSALKHLVKQGIVTEKRADGRSNVYCLNPKKRLKKTSRNQ